MGYEGNVNIHLALFSIVISKSTNNNFTKNYLKDYLSG